MPMSNHGGFYVRFYSPLSTNVDVFNELTNGQTDKHAGRQAHSQTDRSTDVSCSI